MHTGPMPESAGTFEEWKATEGSCIKCNAGPVSYRVWDSSCGGYEDTQFKCDACDHKWWVDGPDA